MSGPATVTITINDNLAAYTFPQVQLEWLTSYTASNSTTTQTSTGWTTTITGAGGEPNRFGTPSGTVVVYMQAQSQQVCGRS